jgi:hypothetical protein
MCPHYDFRSGLDFNIQQLKKGLALFGPLSEKVSELEMILGAIPAARSGLGNATNVCFSILKYVKFK